MVKEQWIPCDGSLRDSTTLYFEHNLEKVKHIAINWALLKRLKEDKALSKVESKLEALYTNKGGGFLSKESKANVIQSEEVRTKLLAEKDPMWRLKSTLA